MNSRFLNTGWTLALGLVVLAGAGCGRESAVKPGAKDPLLCYVGGTMRPAMEELGRRYEAQTGQPVLFDYADSGTLIIKMEQTRRGDLYVAHDPFHEAVLRRGLGTRGWTVAAVTPVIVVPRGNPKGIAGFKDLARPGLRVILSHPTYSTAGWVIPIIARRAGVETALESNVVSRTRAGSEAANAVVIGTADAAICWNAVAHLRSKDLEVIPIEAVFQPRRDVDAITTATYGRLEMDYIRVTVSALSFSTQPEAALAFGRYLASPEAAQVWREFGFTPADPARPARGEGAAALSGSLHVHCAAGMRAPIEEAANTFAREQGVKVDLSYGGSNVLLTQIELTRTGDMYIAGDADYVDLAAGKNLIGERATLCHFVPVILVPKGNPRRIASLSDLTESGCRIAQADGEAAAIGRLMPRLLELNGVDAAAWKKNVALSAPTVNELAIAVKLRTVDAAVVWDAVADDYPDAADIIALPRDRNLVPRVEGAVLSFSTNTNAAAAFLAYLRSDAGKAIFARHGYRTEAP